ncbi:hypothetical protein GYA49_06350 [Candidatus Beckwithbacteria bacterium]|nr:hypothetical protein [Candidatus Beckwithbacteria bacterium]
MTNKRISSRLQRIEDRKNTQQTILFIFLSIGFILILIFIGLPLFVKGVVFLGDMRSSGQTIQTGDTFPPAPPKLDADFEATNSAIIKLTGYAEPESTVTLIKNNDKADETVADDDGSFSFDQIKLMGGTNRLSAYATDAAGNKSNTSSEITIAYDNKAPELTITNPEDGAHFYDEDNEIVIAGETDKDANVTVNGYVVVVDTEGNYVKRFTLQEGENIIDVVATDEAGNKTTKTVKVNYTR